MSVYKSRSTGALSASPTGSSAVFAAPPRTATRLGELSRGSQNGGGWHILRVISQEQDERDERGTEPSAADRRQAWPLFDAASAGQREHGSMKPSNLSLPARSLWFMAAIAATVLGVALLLVYELVSVANDPQLARQ